MTSYNYNASELMELAIQIEKNGKDYYLSMVAKTRNEKVREIFNYLASEEQSHLENFMKISEKLSAREEDIPIADEYSTPEMYDYIKAMFDGRVFPNLTSHDELAKEIKTDEQAVYHAISFEKDTVLFFTEILRMLGDNNTNKSLIEELIRQEKIHIARLYTLLGNLK